VTKQGRAGIGGASGYGSGSGRRPGLNGLQVPVAGFQVLQVGSRVPRSSSKQWDWPSGEKRRELQNPVFVGPDFQLGVDFWSILVGF
jgi:hypothetical protein